MPLSLPRRLLRGLTRAVLLLAGSALALLALGFGLVLGLGVYAWARLSGRPVMRVTGARWPGRGPSAPNRAGNADVVDIDAREVPDGPPRVERLR